MMERTRNRTWADVAARWTAAALGVACLSAGGPHPGPPVFLQCLIEEGTVSLILSGEQKTLRPWFGLDRELGVPLSEDERTELLSAARETLAGETALTIDGVVVEPEFTEAKAFAEFGPGNPEPSFAITLEYACDGRPRTVEVLWQRFPNEPDKAPVVPLHFDAEGEFEFVNLVPEEPGYTWHTQAGLARPRIDVAAVAGERELEPAIAWTGVALLGFAVALLARRKSPAVARTGIAIAGASVVVAVWRGGSGQLVVPESDAAVALFEKLHGNIYQAFQARTEDEIYELLVKSVDLDLLDDLYGEVYESLILRGEGGAVCQIEEVVVLDRGDGIVPRQDEGRAAFDVDWSWQVRGLVTHWGHQHRRTNQYRARYTVAGVGDSWKIAGVETLEHLRADDGAELEAVDAPEEEEDWGDEDWDEDGSSDEEGGP